jgi:isopentenyl-diphosphate delta-isomerase type 1
MDLKRILKTILPGLIPLFVFILVDEIWGAKTGLIVAIIFGIIQFFAIYVKEKRIDKFVLFDIALIVLLGLISVVLQNEVFFKLKPVFIESILLIILGISAFGKKNILLIITGRYLKGVDFNEDVQKKMQNSMRLMFWIFFAHNLLVVYSVFRMSKEAWGFISGVLFYVVFGIVFIIEFVRNRYFSKTDSEEYLAEVDESGKIIGKISRTTAHDGSKRLHPVIHVHVFNSKGDLLLQKRSTTRKIQPGKWDTAVGGHIKFGENIEDAIKRETYEEISIPDVKVDFLTRYVWESEIEKELVFVFITFFDDINFSPNDEVEEVKFWKITEINKNLGKRIFTPNFENEFQKIISNIKFNFQINYQR